MQYRLLINGQLVEGATAMDVINPADGEPFTSCPRADATQAEQAIMAARRAFGAWRDRPVEQRGTCLEELADAMEGQRNQLARLLTQEQGKPLAEAQSEVEASVAALRYHAGIRLAPRILKDSSDEQVIEQRYPLGVVAAIVPWNYPLLLLTLKLAPALIAGNCVIAKPAPTTPLTTLMLGELVADLFPAGVFQTLADGGEIGPLLAAHPDVAHVSLTGSTATGRKVMAAAADRLKRFTLELGGNDAAILLDDVDVEKVAPQLFAGAMANAGQVCLAIKLIYAPRAKIDALCNALVALAERAALGDGLDPATTIGPVQNLVQYKRLVGLLEESRACGRILCGGAVAAGSGYFIPPMIVRDLPDTARLVREEQFGPLLPVLAYDEVEDAIARANASDYGLGGSIWTADPRRGMAVAARIESGLVWVNRIFDLPFEVPIGGARHSGIGRHQGVEGVEEFTQARIVNAALR